MMKFSPRMLSKIRKASRLSAADVVHKIMSLTGASITTTTIYSHEKGLSTPNAEDLANYARVFGVDVNFFYSKGPGGCHREEKDGGS